MAEFTIETPYIDEDGVEQVAVDTYSYTFDGGVFVVSAVDENGELVPQCSQPWNPKGDGSREPWTDEQEAIDWFKSTKAE